MAGNWYQEMEDDLEDRNEAIGRAFVAARNRQMQEESEKKITAKTEQVSILEKENSSKTKQNRVGTNRGVEYVRFVKRDPSVKVMRYEEEYVPELDD